MKGFLIGVAGGALVLAIDLGVAHWGENNTLLRIGVAFGAFLVFFLASFLIPSERSSEPMGKKSFFSGIKSKKSTDIEADTIDTPGATELFTGIESGEDTKIKVGTVKTK